MCRNRKQSEFTDDGRVIAPMNVEGMPWYVRRGESTDGSGPAELTRGEKIAFAWGVIKAVMLVAVVFIGIYLAFILFCTEVWFK